MKNKIYKNKEGIELTCKICGGNYPHLGSHLYHKHGLKAKEYKEEYGLPYVMGLISVEIYNKKVEAFEEDREKYLGNILKDNGHRFKKGHRNGGHRNTEYSRLKAIKEIENVNKKMVGKLQVCVVCKMSFKHMESHLYNKHGLLISK